MTYRYHLVPWWHGEGWVAWKASFSYFEIKWLPLHDNFAALTITFWKPFCDARCSGVQPRKSEASGREPCWTKISINLAWPYMAAMWRAEIWKCFKVSSCKAPFFQQKKLFFFLNLTFCMLGNFPSFCCHLLTGTLPECQTVWIQIRTDQDGIEIWVRCTVCL